MGRRNTRLGEASRADHELPVRLRFKHLGEFVDELAANLSTGGMFIRTARPHPVGSVFEFELELDGGRPPLDGKAQVAWVRRRSDHLEEPVGMGVRFVELDDLSRRHIAEIVAASPGVSGSPAEIQPSGLEGESPSDSLDVEKSAHLDDGAREAATPAAELREPAVRAQPAPAAPPPAQVGRAAAAASEERSPRRVWLLLAVVLAAVLAFAIWRRPAVDPAGPPPTTGSETDAVETAVPEPSAAPPLAALPPRQPDEARALEAWALAWSEQRIEDYLDAYSPRFVPGGGLGRASWERQRRARILAPQSIHVGLAFVEVEEIGPELSRVRFVQAYESESYSDVVRKVIDLERGADGWKILRETVEP